jgi:AraC-like DNA-binding protein
MNRQQLKTNFVSQLGSEALRITQLFEHISDVCFFVKDRQGRFITGNRFLMDKLCVESEEEITGLVDADVFPEDLVNNFLKDDLEVFNTGKALDNRIEMVPNRDGTVEWYVTHKIPLYSEAQEIIGLAGITQNLHRLGDTWKPYHKMSRVIDYISTNYKARIDVKDLAHQINLSVSQFERVFRRNFGMTPVKFINRFRVHQACVALQRTNHTITQIAHDCGFCDHSHLSREFVRIMGKSPGQYRKSH